MATTISTLAAKLVLDTGQWIAGFGRAGKAAQTFAGSLGSSVVSRIGATATAALGAVASIQSFRHSMESIDRNAKLADRLGITNESVQKLGLAADLAGTDVEVLAKGMLTMGRNIGSGGMALDKRFFAVADSIAKIEDPAKRAKRAVEVFGKGGLELINVLTQGGRGIRQSAEAIDQFGLGISRIDAAKVEAANDSLTVLGTVLTGLRNKVAVELAPELLHFTSELTIGVGELQKSIDKLGGGSGGIGGAIGKTLDGLTSGLAGVQEFFITLERARFTGENPFAAYFNTAQNAYKGLQENKLNRMKGLGVGNVSGFLPAALGSGSMGRAERPGAFERGSVEAAKAIQGSSDKTISLQERMLDQLKAIASAVDPMKADGRDGALRLQEAVV